MSYKQPMTTNKIKQVLLRAVRDYLEEVMPDHCDTLAYQDDALEMADLTFRDLIDSDYTRAEARKEADLRFFEEIEQSVSNDIADIITGCFEKHRNREINR